ncbi:MAG: shikimate kinase [Proteobacteria bacterium]|nr:shikimate kinase [Pseudomonadota bacterium]MBU1420389.1 shikimate kinase [Pseudomonadota bacterium]MBU1454399.1 shikimate kinase [Pseudomonadota bacterium]
MKGNIILIGFMGVGKGRTARMLAKKSGNFCVDCDDLIESYTNMKVKNIFKTQGEPRFREYEQIVARWLQKRVRDTIISTGGGFYKVPNIRKIGTVVFLHSEFNQILKAIHSHPKAAQKIKKRPLLQDLKKAETLFKQRLPLYRGVADLEIQVGGRSIDKVTDEIIKRLTDSSC